jgi:hypothetical protein
MDFPERSLPIIHLSEPSLEFAYQQTTAHPKDGAAGRRRQGRPDPSAVRPSFDGRSFRQSVWVPARSQGTARTSLNEI